MGAYYSNEFSGPDSSNYYRLEGYLKKYRKINARDAFLDEFPKSIENASFSESFPELDRVTKDIQDFEIPEIKKVLESESKRTTENIELMGAALPVDQIGIWGSIILAFQQLYMYLHLSSFVSLRCRTAHASEVVLTPWIGIYPSPIARWTTKLSICYLPFLIIVGLTVTNILSQTFSLGELYFDATRIILLLSFLMPLASAYFSMKCLRQLGRINERE